MNTTFVKLAVPAIGLVVALILAFIVYFVVTAWWSQPPAILGFGAIKQPVAFSHYVHVTQAGIDCQFCHRDVSTAAAPDVPPVAQCQFCHKVGLIDGSKSTFPNAQAEIAMVMNANQPIDWIRVNRVPDHVHFNHAAHIQAGISCSVCHGDVASMNVVQPVRSLKMGDCVDCHREHNAPTDCATCHY